MTVTHPDMVRYLMTVGEAARLIVQAGVLGNGGKLFVLDMGQPVKIVDQARMDNCQPDTVRRGLAELESLARGRDTEGIKHKLRELVPSYRPNGHQP